MLTLLQNGGNRISEDLQFKNVPGEDAPHPRPLYWPHFFEPPLLKSWIRARVGECHTKRTCSSQVPRFPKQVAKELVHILPKSEGPLNSAFPLLAAFLGVEEVI